MHFDTKSYLKNTRNHTVKQALSRCFEQAQVQFHIGR